MKKGLLFNKTVLFILQHIWKLSILQLPKVKSYKRDNDVYLFVAGIRAFRTQSGFL